MDPKSARQRQWLVEYLSEVVVQRATSKLLCHMASLVFAKAADS